MALRSCIRTFLLIAFFVFTSSPAHAGELENGHFTSTGLKGDYQAAILKVMGGGFWDGTPFVTEVENQALSRKLKELWAGSEETVNSVLDVGLRLITPKTAESAEELFTVYLRFEGRKMLVRSSKPRSKRYLGGVRTAFHVSDRKDIFIRGHNRTGIAVLHAPYFGKNLQAVLLCPREYYFDKEKASTAILRHNGARVTGAEFNANGLAEGEAVFGYPGTANARVLTTVNVPRSDPFEDRVTDDDVSVDVRYTPVESERERLTAAARHSVPVERIVGGITARLDYTSPSGNTKAAFSRSILTVQEVEFDTQISVEAAGGYVMMEPGRCYLVSSEQAVQTTYGPRGK